MLIESSKGVIVEVTEEKWEELRSHGFSTWKVVKGVTSLPKKEKAKPLRIEMDKPLEVVKTTKKDSEVGKVVINN